MGTLRLLEQNFPGRPSYDTAVSRALLTRVSEGQEPESLRLYVPDDVVAFSVLDRVRPGFEEAVAAARGSDFDAMLRLAGGRAAVFTTQSLAFAWCLPDPEARQHVAERFERLAALVEGALRDLGVDARVGAVPGEYCPGDHSVNAGGRRKLMGVGQRLVRQAAHVGGVIVVRDATRVAQVLEPIYAAMDMPFDPEAVGSIDQSVPDVSLEDVRKALLERFSAEADLVPAEFGEDLLSQAESFESEHRIG